MTNLLQIRSKSGSLEVKYKEFNTILHSQSFNHNNNLSTTTIFLNSGKKWSIQREMKDLRKSKESKRKLLLYVELCIVCGKFYSDAVKVVKPHLQMSGTQYYSFAFTVGQ